MKPATQALVDATALLAPVSETPRLDAELLLAHALGMERSTMLLQLRDLYEPASYAALITRRLSHEPVAYILGYQHFRDLELIVTPAVLIPRADSETLIDAALEAFANGPPSRILDLGTGSGALLLAALSCFPGASGVGIDASRSALAVARANAVATGLAARCDLVHASWHDTGWSDRLGTFDLILCNPPYVETTAELAAQVREYEPASALFAGPDGLDEYRLLIPQMPALLAPGGVAIFELGRGQDAAVIALARDGGFAATTRKDLSGIPRVAVLTA